MRFESRRSALVDFGMELCYHAGMSEVNQLEYVPGTVEVPDLHDRRYRKRSSGEYWIVEEWMECDCPDCDEEAHWIGIAGLTEEKEAIEMVESC